VTDKKGKIVDELYDHVLQVVNRILHNAKNYNMSVLKLEDPSYSEIAEQLKNVCKIMEIIAGDLPGNGGTNHQYTASKALEYTEQVAKIANAINRGDEEELETICKELDGRSFL